jgi:hypothetical protein
MRGRARPAFRPDKLCAPLARPVLEVLLLLALIGLHLGTALRHRSSDLLAKPAERSEAASPSYPRL